MFWEFAVLWQFAKVFFTKFGGVASFGTADLSNPRKFSPQKSYFSPNRESFLPRKFSAIRYLDTYSLDTYNLDTVIIQIER